MPESPVWIPTGSAPGTPVDVIERASPDITTLTTADPGASTSGTTGQTLAATLRDRFPQSGNFKIDVGGERMLVTAGQGTGAGNFTVTRGIDGTSAPAHVVGTVIALVTGVQRVEPIYGGKQVIFKGRIHGFRTPGRAGTTGQKILAIHNAAGSGVTVDVLKCTIDVVSTAAAGIAPSIIPPIIRAWKFTAVPTNGTALTKVQEDSKQTSNASVTAWGDASADGTNSATALTITLPAGMFAAQEFKPRMLVVGTSASTFYEPFDRTVFLEDEDEVITLNALEGLAIFLDYTVATANPITDFYVPGLRYIEYTNA